MAELCELFYRYFDVLVAMEPEDIDEVFRLRYQVYCVEHDYEDASQFKDGKEIDAYDRRSVFSLVRHLQSGITAATVRLVLPDPDHPENLFPIEENCASSLAINARLFSRVPRNGIAEISRFAVSKEFKRRAGEASHPAGIGPSPDSYLPENMEGKRVIPHLILGLFAAIVRMSAQNNITHWYAVMDRSLLRLLKRFGIHFMPIGSVIDYHGLRQPCFGCIDTVLEGIWKERHGIWRLITDDGRVWPAPQGLAGECLHASLDLVDDIA